MKILVLSDTHLGSPDKAFLRFFERECLRADALLHCGDMTGYPMLELFETHPRFFGVAGNTDHWQVADELPPTRIVELEGVRIGMAHGHGYSHPIGHNLMAGFGDGADMACYGHTHVPEHAQVGSRHILNPGSYSHPRHGSAAGFVLVQVEDGSIVRVEHRLRD